jgi:hypothetical protein
VLSLVLFSTTSGIYVLDVVDHFVNQYGILVVRWSACWSSPGRSGP